MLITALLCMALQTVQAGAEPQAVTDPIWIKTPTAKDLARNWPAQSPAVQGVSTLACTVTDTGALTNCTVRAERPQGAGFGEASLRLAAKFKMKTKDRLGAAVAGRPVNIPILWRPL